MNQRKIEARKQLLRALGANADKEGRFISDNDLAVAAYRQLRNSIAQKGGLLDEDDAQRFVESEDSR